MSLLLSVLIGVIAATGVAIGVGGVLILDAEYNITRLHQGCHLSASYDAHGHLSIGSTVLCLNGNPHPKEK